MEIGDAGPWLRHARAVTHALERAVPGLVGVYLHGSAALGGFGSASDLDVLVVAEDEAGTDWRAIGATLLRAAADERPVELSIVSRGAAADPSAPWPFLLHVNIGDDRVVVGGEGGDRDLIAHYAVVRAAGLRLWGAPPRAVVGAVERGQLLDYLAGELEWGLAEADQRYAVLNAARAVAFAEEGALLSKLAGGRWWLEKLGAAPVISTALTAQRDGVDLGPSDDDARAFVAAAIARLGVAAR